MSDPVSTTGYFFTLKDAVITIVGTAFVLPFAKWAFVQLWAQLKGRPEEIKAEAEKDKQALQKAIESLSTDVKAGFAALQAAVGRQDVTIAQVSTQVGTNTKEIENLRAGQHDVRDQMSYAVGQVKLLTLLVTGKKLDETE